MDPRRVAHIVDRDTDGVCGSVGLRHMGDEHSDSSTWLTIATWFQCPLCFVATYLEVASNARESFYTAISDQPFQYSNTFIPLIDSDMENLYIDLSQLFQWDFVVKCSMCQLSLMCNIEPMTTTKLSQKISPTECPWPVQQRQRWILPKEVQWVLSKWRKVNFDFTIHEEDMEALTINRNQGFGQVYPWKMKALLWARNRFDVQTTAFCMETQALWFSWLTEICWNTLSMDIEILNGKDRREKPRQPQGLGIRLEQWSPSSRDETEDGLGYGTYQTYVEALID